MPLRVTATYSPEDNKLRLYASTRLDAETYARVKAAGFGWAPKQELFVAPKWTPEREDLALELAGEIEPEEMTLAERAAIKAERLDNLAAKRHGESVSLNQRADELSQAFYMGQPILIGHHSERKARKTQERMNAAQGAAIKAGKAADYWLYRATGVERFANMKNNPRVRANRIKTLLAELRDLQRGINAAHYALKLWDKYTTDEHIRAVLNRVSSEISLAGWQTYSAVEKGEMTPAQARENAIARANLTINGPKRARWLEHLLSRLAFERSMLGDVPRFEDELTPVIIQAFAREHGAEKPKCTIVEEGFLLLESPVPLPAHIAEESAFLELSDDEWRDVMQACGYIVPAKKDAAPPILNLNVSTIEAKARAGNWRNAETEIVSVVHVTKAQYSKVGNDYRGTRLSACGTFRFKVASARALGVPGAEAQWNFVGVFLTDSKAHPLPESIAARAAA
jgi:hypothetical protein